MGFLDDVMGKIEEEDTPKIKAVKGFIREQDLSPEEMSTLCGWAVVETMAMGVRKAMGD